MIVVKLLLKIVCIPILAILTLMQLVLSFLSVMTGWMFHLLALIIFVTGGLSWGFGLESSTEALKLIYISFVLSVIPHIAPFIIDMISLLKSWLI